MRCDVRDHIYGIVGDGGGNIARYAWSGAAVGERDVMVRHGSVGTCAAMQAFCGGGSGRFEGGGRWGFLARGEWIGSFGFRDSVGGRGRGGGAARGGDAEGHCIDGDDDNDNDETGR